MTADGTHQKITVTVTGVDDAPAAAAAHRSGQLVDNAVGNNTPEMAINLDRLCGNDDGRRSIIQGRTAEGEAGTKRYSFTVGRSGGI